MIRGRARGCADLCRRSHLQAVPLPPSSLPTDSRQPDMPAKDVPGGIARGSSPVPAGPVLGVGPPLSRVACQSVLLLHPVLIQIPSRPSKYTTCDRPKTIQLAGSSLGLRAGRRRLFLAHACPEGRVESLFSR
jgi:hypothetical protein